MWSAEVVLVCALSMLGRSERSLPPIEFVSTLPADVSPGAEGFVRLGDRRIYLVVTTPAFKGAQQSIDRCGNTNAVRKIASVIVHEEVHLKQGAGERLAYEAQLTTLTALGAGPSTGLYREVVMAMRHATRKQPQRQPADGLLASGGR